MDMHLFSQVWDAIRNDTLEYNPRVLRRYTQFSQEVYGEVHPCFVDRMVRDAQIGPDDVFFDLGSGVGNVVLQVAAQTGCCARGVEIRADLHDIATKLKTKYETKVLMSTPSV
jgi:ubiquinone/menaquinone biosynthesis C-methylase UbiE